MSDVASDPLQGLDLTTSGNVSGTASVFQRMLREQMQREEANRKSLETSVGVMDQLEAKAQANTSSFIESSKLLNKDTQQVYQNLEKTRSMGPLGKILGIVDSDYNEKALVTRGQANQAAITANKNDFDANNSLINEQVQGVQHKVQAQNEIANMGRQSLTTLMTGVNTIINARKDDETIQTQRLASLSPDELKGALEKSKGLDDINIGGVSYPKQVVFNAYTARQELNGKLIQLDQAIKLGAQNLHKGALENYNTEIDEIAKRYTPQMLQQLVSTATPDGRASLPGVDGKTITTVDVHDFTDRVFKQNAAMQPVRDAMAKMTVGAGDIVSEFDKLTEQSARLLRMTSTNADEPELTKLNSTNPNASKLLGTMSAVAQRRRKYADAAENPLMSPEQLELFVDPNQRAVTGALHDQMVTDQKTLLDSMKQGRPDFEKDALDQIYNFGNIQSTDTALKVFAGGASVSSAFAGNYSALGVAIAPAIQKLVNQKSPIVSPDGKVLDAKAFAEALFSGASPIHTITPEQKYAVAEQALSNKADGTKDGLSVQGVGQDINYLTRNALVGYVAGIKKAGGSTPFESLIQPDGSWTPSMQAKISVSGGATNALYQTILDADAKSIADGKLTVDDNNLDKFNTYLLNQIRTGKLKLETPANLMSASARKLIYDNEMPEQRLLAIFNRNAQLAPALLVKHVKALTEATGPGKGMQPGNRGEMQSQITVVPTPAGLQQSMLDYYKKKTGLEGLP